MSMLACRVAIVTGAAQGIGLATTQLLLKSGAKVGLVDINEDKLQQTCGDLGQQYRKEDILCLPCDVTDQKRMKEVFQGAKDHYGSLDVVVNNAGIGDEVNWKRALKVNLEAVITGTYLAQELFAKEKGGVVVNVSSMGGLFPVPFAPVYCATKHGIIGFSRSLKYLAQTSNIRVNCICPFFADTELGREGIAFLKKHDPKSLKDGIVSIDKVAEGILELITDTTKAGAVLRATPQGLTYKEYPRNWTTAENF